MPESVGVSVVQTQLAAAHNGLRLGFLGQEAEVISRILRITQRGIVKRRSCESL